MYRDGMRVGGRKMDPAAATRATGMEQLKTESDSGKKVVKEFVFDQSLEDYQRNLPYNAVQRQKAGAVRGREDDWHSNGKDSLFLSAGANFSSKTSALPHPADLVALSELGVAGDKRTSSNKKPVPPMYQLSSSDIGFRVDEGSDLKTRAMATDAWHGKGTAFSDSFQNVMYSETGLSVKKPPAPSPSISIL